MNAQYLHLAYERAVFASLRRHAMEKFLQGGGSPKESVICESVPLDLATVPNEVIVEVIQRIEEEEKRLTDEMAQYDFRQKEARPIPKLAQDIPPFAEDGDGGQRLAFADPSPPRSVGKGT